MTLIEARDHLAAKLLHDLPPVLRVSVDNLQRAVSQVIENDTVLSRRRALLALRHTEIENSKLGC